MLPCSKGDRWLPMTTDKRDGQIPDDSSESPVDATLELDLTQVEQAVEQYLASPGDVQRKELVAQLTALDDQIAKSDAYESSVFGSGIFGHASKGLIIGETSDLPFVDEVATAVFQAQVALVRAAKLEIEEPTPKTMDDLGAAFQTLKRH